MKQLKVLDKIQENFSLDSNVLAMLVFGSVARGTFREKSDIDLSIVYKDFEPGFEFSKGEVDGIEIGYSKWSIDNLREYIKQKPYRGYIFAHANLLFDRSDVKLLQKELLSFFDSHPDIEQEWISLGRKYQADKKKHTNNQNGIFDVYQKLDEKYTEEKL